MFTWRRREKKMNRYVPCDGVCLFCKYFNRHEEELTIDEAIYLNK